MGAAPGRAGRPAEARAATAGCSTTPTAAAGGSAVPVTAADGAAVPGSGGNWAACRPISSERATDSNGSSAAVVASVAPAGCVSAMLAGAGVGSITPAGCPPADESAVAALLSTAAAGSSNRGADAGVESVAGVEALGVRAFVRLAEG